MSNKLIRPQDYELSPDEKAQAIKLAMKIDLGDISTKRILDEINADTIGWLPILAFWTKCSAMTRSVIDRLHLETTWQRSLSK